jgi:hypothetical protein
MAVLGASSLQIDSATLGSQSGSAPMFAARARVSYNGGTTTTVYASANVSSVTRIGTSTHTITFSTSMPSADYAANYSASAGLSSPGAFRVMQVYSRAIGSCSTQTRDTANNTTNTLDKCDVTFLA